jgi:Phosphotransferase enzyme family
MKIQIAEPVQNFLARRYGRLQKTTRLGGQSLSAVYRLYFGMNGKTLSHTRTAILKVSDRAAENYFYRRIAPQLKWHGVAMPRLDYAVTVAGRSWLVLEDISEPFPRGLHFADPNVVATLYRLHSAKLDITPRPDFYRPVWTPELNRAAMALLPDGAKLLTALDDLAARSACLFEPCCPVSGDPNLSNWGVRSDNTPVLYDWERFTFATPAVDLGIVMPGLSHFKVIEPVARLYAAHSGADVRTLSRDMLVVKIWSVVEYLAGYATGKMRRSVRLNSTGFHLFSTYLAEQTRQLAEQPPTQ